MHIEASDVTDYIDKCPPKRQDALRTLRDLVLSVNGDVVENLEYGMPTYWIEGQVLCAFASQKRHMSLYLDVDLLASHRAGLRQRTHLPSGSTANLLARVACASPAGLDKVRALHQPRQGAPGHRCGHSQGNMQPTGADELCRRCVPSLPDLTRPLPFKLSTVLSISQH